MTHEYYRRRLYKQASLEYRADMDAIRKDIDLKCDGLDAVVVMAKDRLTIGTFRYGVSSHNYDYGNEILNRVERYMATGNRENLVDALNFCALEFNHPFKKDTYFEAQDDSEHTRENYDW